MAWSGVQPVQTIFTIEMVYTVGDQLVGTGFVLVVDCAWCLPDVQERME